MQGHRDAFKAGVLAKVCTKDVLCSGDKATHLAGADLPFFLLGTLIARGHGSEKIGTFDCQTDEFKFWVESSM